MLSSVEIFFFDEFLVSFSIIFHAFVPLFVPFKQDIHIRRKDSSNWMWLFEKLSNPRVKNKVLELFIIHVELKYTVSVHDHSEDLNTLLDR